MAHTITPNDRLIILGLFMLNDELTKQQEGIMRSITKLVDPIAGFQAVPVNDHVSDAIYGADGNPEKRVDEMLRKMDVEVKVPVPEVAGENFYPLAMLERARNWLRTEFSEEGGGSETMETHYLTNDLMRIPSFNSWVHLLSETDARDVYFREQMLQFHKDDIILAALQGGMSY